MLKFCSLYSGSSGNSIFIGTDKAKILVDSGLSCKKITEALLSIEEDPEEISAILLTHEHNDHTKGLSVLSRKFDIPIYVNEMTWQAISDSIKDIDSKNIKIINNEKEFEINGLGIKAFPIPHDANDPVGFCFYFNGKKITIATDIGHIDTRLTECLLGSDLLLLESNHDINMLEVGSYPWWLKKRILGEKGHLSNEAAGEVIAYMAEKGTQHFVLGHLSVKNNFPQLAYQTTYNALAERKICVGTDVTLEVAPKDRASNIIYM